MPTDGRSDVPVRLTSERSGLAQDGADLYDRWCTYLHHGVSIAENGGLPPQPPAPAWQWLTSGEQAAWKRLAEDLRCLA